MCWSYTCSCDYPEALQDHVKPPQGSKHVGRKLASVYSCHLRTSKELWFCLCGLSGCKIMGKCVRPPSHDI